MNMRWVIVFSVVTMLAFGTTPLLAQPRPGTPGPNSMMPMDVGRHFIEQMIPHHDDAVKMADLAPAQAEHPELRDLAEKIKRVQTDEIALMRGWYQTWYGTAVPSSTTRGMAMGRSDSMVLDGARPFDKVFIEQMIPHHGMAVMMSRMALQSVSRPELRGLLQSIITSQSAEIAQMRRWYATWYGVAAPGAGPGTTAGHHMGSGMGSNRQMGSGMSGPSSVPGHHGQAPSGASSRLQRRSASTAPRRFVKLQPGWAPGWPRRLSSTESPGPRHALDLAVELRVSAQQRTRLQAIYDDMHRKAVTAGQRYIRAQEALEKDFRDGRMTANALPKRVAEVNRLRGELETVHLAAHLATAQVLSPDQVAQYNRLRGHSAN